MPIYAYKCASCGHAKDVLQKMSDDPLTSCPACGAEAFTKQLTAAGFQLKGSGWYVTDFRDGTKPDSAKPGIASPGDSASSDGKPADSAKAETGTAANSTPAPAPAASPAPAPAAVSTPSGTS
jgi:putative FmdB family regulatory protein